MPIGGFDGLGWDETVPSDGESASLGDDRIRSLKTSVRNGLDAEHVWSSSGGNGQGVHRQGSARVFVATQSAVSSSGTDGRLLWASDTSRLFHPGSGGTVYLGGPYVLSVGSMVGISWPQRHILQVDFGQGITGSSGSTIVTIPNSGYSGVPFIQLTSIASISGVNAIVQAVPIDGAQFIVNAYAAAASSFLSGCSFHWQSMGTRVL